MTALGIMFGCVDLLVFWLIGIFLDKVVRTTAKKRKSDNPVFIAFLGKIIKYACFTIGIISFAGQMGLDIRGILAGLGLTGFALGFALKDTLSNIVSGVFILFYKPFSIGQTISLEINKGVLSIGTVTAIDLRYTTLENNQEIILVPNAILFTNVITVKKPSTTTTK